MNKKNRIKAKTFIIILIGVLMFGCSVLKDIGFPSHERSVQSFLKKNYHGMEFSNYKGNMEIIFVNNDTIIILDSLEIFFNAINTYYLELTNENSDRKTDLKTFINGAGLTYISLPLVII